MILDSICVITANFGGGTTRHATEMAYEYSKRCVTVFIKFTEHAFDVHLLNDGIIIKKYLFLGDERKRILSLFLEQNVKLIHIHHFMHMDQLCVDLIFNTGIPIGVTLHDYYVVCPRISCVCNGKFCNSSSSSQCIECLTYDNHNLDYGKILVPYRDIDVWRSFYFNLLKQVKYIFVPSYDVGIRVAKYMPCISSKICMIENPEIITPQNIEFKSDGNSGLKSKNLTVGILGKISHIKGQDVLLDVAEIALSRNVKISFIVFGTLSECKRKIPANISVKGQYKEEEIYRIIAEEKIDFFWFPGICPETYSYTLTIPIRLHLPVIAADIGAIAERVKRRGWGNVYNLRFSNEEILNFILNFDYEKFANAGDFKIYNDKFLSFEDMYPGIEFSKNKNHESVFCQKYVIFGNYKNLLPRELKLLWNINNQIKWKIRLLIYTDKAELLKKFFIKLIEYFKFKFC